MGRGMQSALRFGKITEPIMSLTLGTRVGPYANLATIGVGGKGEMYRACKTAVTSDVARNVLKERFTADRARIRRRCDRQ